MNRIIKLNKKEIEEIIDIIRKKEDKYFRFLSRDIETNKNPNEYMVEIEIDKNDAIKIIKGLSVENFYLCQLDTKHSFIYLYSFKCVINDNKTYIKIGFLYDMKTGDVIIVSFHKDIELEG